ncbi:MAG: hypothetical protein ACOC5T_05335 [Elusimicrobiota bacterium]
MPLPRNCDRCGIRFQPERTRMQKLCPKCLKEVKDVNFIKLICHRRGITLNILNKNWKK